MGRKSQLEKFNSKLSKKKADEVAINSRVYQEQQAEYKKYGAEGVGELMSKGNIKEAAVVFSREGMNAFAHMFGNSVESAVINVLDKRMNDITKGMESHIEAIIEAKMLEMLEGMTEGMKQLAKPPVPESSEFIENMIKRKADEIKKQLEEPKKQPVQITLESDHPNNNISTEDVEKKIEELQDKGILTKPVVKSDNIKLNQKKATRERPVIADAPRPKKDDYFTDINVDDLDLLPVPAEPGHRYGSGKEDVKVIAPYVLAIMKKYKDVEIRSTELLAVLRKHYNIKMINPTLTFRKVSTIDPNFESVGFGVYKYEEKTFKPTI